MAVEHGKGSDRIGQTKVMFCLLAVTVAASLITTNAQQVPEQSLPQHRIQKESPALLKARSVLLTAPSSATAHYELARLLQQENLPAESLQVFTKAAALRRPSSEDLRLVGLDYVLLNDTADARHWLSASVSLDPHNAVAWYDFARNEMMIGDYGKAEKAMRQSLALEPKQVKAEDNLGVILEALNRPEEAEQAYRRSIELQTGLDAPSEQPLLNYGLLLISRGQSAAALPLLRQAVVLAPADPRCLAALGHAEADTGNVAIGADRLKQAIALDERNPRLHFQLGQLYRQLGRPADATSEMERSQQLYAQHSSEPGTGK